MSLPTSKKLEPLYHEIKHLSYEQKPELLNYKIELLKKVNEDILLIQEIYSQPSRLSYEDAAWIIKNSLESLRMFANSLHVLTHFSIDSEKDAELAYENLKTSNPVITTGMISPYSLFINSRGLSIIAKKLMEIGLFLASSKPSGQLSVSIKTVKSPQHKVVLTIECDSPILTKEDCDNLLVQNYPNIKQPNNLYFASGLEGVIAKTLSQQLGVNIETSFNSFNSRLTFLISIGEKTAAPVHTRF